jgi:hypothetical protein
MGLLDFLLFPLYVTLFYFIFKSRRNRYNDPVLSYYHNIGFWIKVFSALAFTIFNTYISVGDSLVLYYTEGANIYKMILKDASNVKWLFLPGTSFDQSLLHNSANQGYFRSENNYMVTRITAFFSFFTLGRYLITNLFFAMVAFSGLWRLYRFFYQLYPHLHKQIGIAVLFLPTVVFWSSGILKDSICISALGWITWALYESFYKKKNLLINFIIIAISGYMLWILKAYILVSYVPFFFLFLFLKNISLIKSGFTKALIFAGILMVSAIMFSQIKNKLIEALGEYAVGGLTTSIQNKSGAYSLREATSSFSLGVDMSSGISTAKLALIAPAAIVATFFRPFLWESRNVSTLLSSFESLFIMFYTLSVIFKTGLLQFFKTIYKNPVVLYCILFSLLFAVFVGATTQNFGSLVRYKIPCMPFFVMAIFLIQDANRQKKENLLKNKQV